MAAMKLRALAGMLMVAVLSATTVSCSSLQEKQGGGSESHPMGWDKKEVGELFDAGVFNGASLTTCDLGDEFYSSLNWEDIELIPGRVEGAERCEGWLTTDSGKASAQIFVVPDGMGAEGAETLKETGLEDWSDFSDSPDKCELRSDRDEFKGTRLYLSAPCEALYPMAKQLSNLANFNAGNGKEFVDPAVGRGTGASPDYSAALENAKDLHEPGDIASTMSEGTTLTPNKVVITQEPSQYFDANIPQLCVETEFYVGSVTEDGEFELPSMRYINPSGETTELDKVTGAGGLFASGGKRDVKYCGFASSGLKDTDLVLVATGIGGEEASRDSAHWKFTVDGSQEQVIE
nr:Uncharacterised protein [Streptococcus thermophilus]